MKTIEQRLQTIEELLLLIVPWHKLTPEQRDRMPVTEKVVEIEAGDRKRIVRNEFLRMVTAPPSVRIAAKYPRELIPQPDEELLPIAPLSLLVNRCKARKSFAVLPGEKSTADNVMKTLDELGIVTATLEDLGFARFSLVQVVLNKDTRSRFNPVKWKEEEPETLSEDEEEDDEEPAPLPVRKKKDDGITFDWSSVGKDGPGDPALDEEEEDGLSEETFEESEAAQGVASIPSRDLLDDDEEEVEDVHDSSKGVSPWQETLSDTTDDVEEEDDGDWGPDEVDFPNPIREQFEREATEAAAREQAKLASGEYFLLDGKVTKKKGR